MRICIFIEDDKMLYDIFTGLEARVLSEGEPVARAREAKESIIRFTHRSCIGVSTESSIINESTKVTSIVTELAVS